LKPGFAFNNLATVQYFGFLFRRRGLYFDRITEESFERMPLPGALLFISRPMAPELLIKRHEN